MEKEVLKSKLHFSFYIVELIKSFVVFEHVVEDWHLLFAGKYDLPELLRGHDVFNKPYRADNIVITSLH